MSAMLSKLFSFLGKLLEAFFLIAAYSGGRKEGFEEASKETLDAVKEVKEAHDSIKSDASMYNRVRNKYTRSN